MGTSGGIDVGDHVCGFYWGVKGRNEILLPYLRAGLRAGERCMCVVHTTEPAELLNLLGDEATVQGWLQNRELDVRSSSSTYLNDGRFSLPDMIGFYEEFLLDATQHGNVARVVGEGNWVVEDYPGVQDLMDYESEINHTVAKFPQMILCLYDLELFDGDMLADILKTHPKVMLGDMVLDNPNYLTPEEFKADRQAN